MSCLPSFFADESVRHCVFALGGFYVLVYINILIFQKRIKSTTKKVTFFICSVFFLRENSYSQMSCNVMC